MKKATYLFEVKPVSANAMFAGAQYYKRKPYVQYQKLIWDHLDKCKAYWEFGVDPVSVLVNVGLSSKAADLDNVIKPLLDTLQSYFEEFDDKAVYEIYLKKSIVKRGKEFLDVTIKDFLPTPE